MSAVKGDKGEWRIDPAELFRVFPKENGQNTQKERNETPENTFQNRLLEQEVQYLREQLEREREINRDVGRRLDQEAEERRKLTLMLTDQREHKEKAALPAPGRIARAWAALTGKA